MRRKKRTFLLYNLYIFFYLSRLFFLVKFKQNFIFKKNCKVFFEVVEEEKIKNLIT